MTDLDGLASGAVDALLNGRIDLRRDADQVPRVAGLYAVHGETSVWQTLGLGEPPDRRPLYVGKAEHSLAGRDVGTHFGTGRTGSSTVRRSLAGLLQQQLGLRACPRNLARPDRSANFALEPDGDERLTAWMLDHLRLAVWPSPASISLDALETLVLAALVPPLNIDKVTSEWRPRVKAARARLVAEARAWTPARLPESAD